MMNLNLCNVIDTSSIQTEQSYKFTFSDHTEVYDMLGPMGHFN